MSILLPILFNTACPWRFDFLNPGHGALLLGWPYWWCSKQLQGILQHTLALSAVHSAGLTSGLRCGVRAVLLDLSNTNQFACQTSCWRGTLKGTVKSSLLWLVELSLNWTLVFLCRTMIWLRWCLYIVIYNHECLVGMNVMDPSHPPGPAPWFYFVSPLVVCLHWNNLRDHYWNSIRHGGMFFLWSANPVALQPSCTYMGTQVCWTYVLMLQKIPKEVEPNMMIKSELVTVVWGVCLIIADSYIHMPSVAPTSNLRSPKWNGGWPTTEQKPPRGTLASPIHGRWDAWTEGACRLTVLPNKRLKPVRSTRIVKVDSVTKGQSIYEELRYLILYR